MSIFLERVTDLINKNGITKNKLLVELGLGKNSFINWEKRGSVPNGNTLQSIADYFNVSTDYLLGNDTSKTKDPATDDDLMFALFNGKDGVTPEMFEEVKNFAQLVKLREEQKKKGKK